MSNIWLKVTIEKLIESLLKLIEWKLRFSKSRFSPSQFLESSNSRRLTECKDFFLQLKNQKSGSNSVCGFSVVLILKEIMVFYSKSTCFLLNKKLTVVWNRATWHTSIWSQAKPKLSLPQYPFLTIFFNQKIVLRVWVFRF